MSWEVDAGWRQRASRVVFECPWMKMRQDDIILPGGEEIQYHVVERPSSSAPIG